MSVISKFFQGTAHTEFLLEIHAIVQLAHDNQGESLRHLSNRLSMPVTVLGEGNYGVAFTLDNYPDMVLKVCRCASDGYPEYIRQVAALGVKRKRWMPEILAHGGNEVLGMFWCVMPKYDNPCGEGRGSPYMQGGDWHRAGGDKLARVLNEDRLLSGHRLEHWNGAEYKPGTAFLAGMTKRERRDARQMQDFFRPMREHGAEFYMHAGNALKKGEQWIITDPIAGWYNKASFSNANS